MVKLWNDETIKKILKIQKLRLEDLGGLYVPFHVSLQLGHHLTAVVKLPRFFGQGSATTLHTHRWYAGDSPFRTRFSS